VKKNVLQMSDEDIEEMNKQIEKEPEPVPMGPNGQPVQEQPEQPTAEQFPPEDNVSDRGSSETETPELDNIVKRFSRVINNQ
jgi:hypothetical protein